MKATYSELQEVVKEKEQRIEEQENQLLKERLRNLELEKRLAKDSHSSSKLPSSDGYKQREKSQKTSGGQEGVIPVIDWPKCKPQIKSSSIGQYVVSSVRKSCPRQERLPENADNSMTGPPCVCR